MAKIKMGFDIGSNRMKIAVNRAGRLEFHDIRLPENMIENGEIAMPNTFADFLKNTRKSLRLPKGDAALALSLDQAICRLVTMPRMTEEQLLLNLPYEFSDLIHGDADRYFCDYAVCTELFPEKEGTAQFPESSATGEDLLDEEGEMQQDITMMAAVASKEQLYQYIRIFARAGIRLKVLLPQEMALISLMKGYFRRKGDENLDYCFVDLGHLSTTIMVTYRDRIQATRQIAIGGRNLDAVIADHLGVDEFLANSYKLKNYQNVLENPVCQDIYNRISVEILKVINFYQFTYPDSRLDGIYLVGGGANIKPLRHMIRDTLTTELLSVKDLLPQTADETPDWLSGIYAAGVSMAEKGG